jgi:UDP-glucose:(heptosyl)LPS alpha-1,3-glucosyltransferase
MELAHVVGSYGPVGGLESYAWDLTQGLAAAGHRVTVLCADTQAADPGPVTVVPLGTMNTRRGWLWALSLSARVADWLRAHPVPGRIVHSHVRTGSHHVTTFHTTPFLHPRRGPGLDLLSPRVFAHWWMERRELLGAAVQAVVPVSAHIGELLRERYPAARIAEPIAPAAKPVAPRVFRRVDPRGGRIGFIGREWKRKGLPFALRVVEALAARRPQLEFVVAGPPEGEVRDLFAAARVPYRLAGWVDTQHAYRDLDLLLHPAEREAFGMVLTEALSAGVPVVASSACGAAPVVAVNGGAVLGLDAGIEAWAAACDRQLDRDAPLPPYRRGGDALCEDYARVYARIVDTVRTPL